MKSRSDRGLAGLTYDGTPELKAWAALEELKSGTYDTSSNLLVHKLTLLPAGELYTYIKLRFTQILLTLRLWGFRALLVRHDY